MTTPMVPAAAMRAAEELGYSPFLLSTTLDVEAREAGRLLAEKAHRVLEDGTYPLPCAIVAGGETVVHLTGRGKGGRNQEVALAAVEGIAGLPKTVVASVGSDGTDGPTDAAGGIVDGGTAERLRELGLDIASVLRDNDSYNALKAADCLVVTGPTGTNVNDLMLLLLGR